MVGLMPRIEQVWMALAVDPDDGNEGVVAELRNGMWTPLLAADPARLAHVRERAAMLAYERGQLVRIAKLTVREDTEEFDGRRA